jgi:hypothetical protein
MKGMESLPLRYIALIIIAVIIMASFIQITNMVATTAMAASQTANGTLLSILDNSLSHGIGNFTP